MKIVFILLPISVIGFCCWFFSHAFNCTMAQCTQRVSPVQILAQSTGASNEVVNALTTSPVQQVIKEALTDRSMIAEKEHDKFRAELATWLSVFGLLSILATLVVPACAYLLQQKEFDKLQKILDNQREAMENLKKDVKEMQDDMQSEVKVAKKEINIAKSEVTNTAEALRDSIEEECTANNGCFGDNDSDSLKTLLYKFKMLWGDENIEKKLQAGLELFEACNKEIDKAIEENNPDRLSRSINMLNNANAYLGTSNLYKFKPLFVDRLKDNRPLTHSFEKVNEIIKDKHPQAGFYQSVLKLQR